MFSAQDKEQISQHGISLEEIMHQIDRFIAGFPYSDIVRPADPSRGIRQYTAGEQEALAARFDEDKQHLAITKFVPASGAATRMFKDLYSLRDSLAGKSSEEQERIIGADGNATNFFSQLKTFPFYEDLVQGGLHGSGLAGHERVAILDGLLTESGLGYGTLPKGLLKFHSYPSGARTAFEEHLWESPGFCSNGSEVSLHFTVSPEHEDGFRALQERVLPGLEAHHGIRYNISYSSQQPSTDTLAVDMENRPFRDASGRLVFRPGGHGALLENLDAIDADLIFISNIDNVGPERVQPQRIHSKKFLGGLLLELRHEIFSFQESLVSGTGNQREVLERTLLWMKETACMDIPGGFAEWPLENQREWVLEKLDRPIRVCGMVKNEGEPGGGPFFVRDASGAISLQIVELSQVNMADPAKQAIVGESTHFNPVDLACSVKDRNGKKYRLTDFRDPATGFISHKSMAGRDLKALELPGLWNGSMANWLTVFVEVPAATFSPVKTVFDLIRPEHL
jgi:hypothetical protein